MGTETAYYNLTIDQVAEKLQTSLENGLSTEEAKKRLEIHGYNEFEKKKKRGILYKFIQQFKSFMIIVLLAAAIISGVVGCLRGEGFTDALIILFIVILNALIGTIQEAKAEQSLEALEKMSAPQCKVIRDGQVEVIESRELAPGDLVVLDTGDAIPADLRLTETVNLKIQDAALTGESIPEEKFTEVIEQENTPLGDRDNLGFSSSTVTYGRGKGIVIETGMKTEVGKIAAMIQSVPETKTPLQEKLDKLGKFLGIGALVICIFLFIVGVLYGKNITEMFMTAVSLAAAAIPEGLPAVSTIVLAVGVQRLVKKNAIVRTLPAVETLGSTTVICSDKTGTLTQNRMTVVKIYVDGHTLGVSEEIREKDPGIDALLKTLILANDAKLRIDDGEWKTTGDPTETALLDLGVRFRLIKNDLENEFPRIAEIPFDSERKMMTTINKNESGNLTIHTKGGLDEILSCCDHVLVDGQVKTLTEDAKTQIREANVEMAGKALRVLAAATKDISALPEKIEPSTIETGFIFIGMAGMIDPPRGEVKDAVEKCRTAGIKPVMITGDHKITAQAIALDLGIMYPGEESLTGADVEKMTDDELLKNVHSVAVYARVSPEHKVRIVNAFQRSGNIVAMTGDGVNDAPALKLADIGCAMGITGTDVSKEAADVVLTDDNFATIVTAVEEGRRIYNNILKAIQFMLSTNIGEIVVLFIAVPANWISPLLPIHILWINLVTDSLPALSLSVDPADADIMQQKPVDSGQGIMNKAFATRIFLQGTMIGLLSLTAYIIGMYTSNDVQGLGFVDFMKRMSSFPNVVTAQTMTFAVLALSQITHVFNVRSTYHSAFKGFFSNKLLLGAIFPVVALMLIVLEVPALHGLFKITGLTGEQWMWVTGLSFAPLLIMETVKGLERLLNKNKS
ncbi:MAG: cation-translocating P-type ATPase [Dysgonamonadaceae bacterium]|jgi:Ca2+-transporting ATPase|nr:cation-translocating P-type ATPase [Dysgonamonadaceae bacterium]